VVVAGDQLHSAQTAHLQDLQKGSPVDFVFAQGYGNAQDFAFSGQIDPENHHHRADQHRKYVKSLTGNSCQHFGT
jgi:hypothetical protein